MAQRMQHSLAGQSASTTLDESPETLRQQIVDINRQLQEISSSGIISHKAIDLDRQKDELVAKLLKQISASTNLYTTIFAARVNNIKDTQVPCVPNPFQGKAHSLRPTEADLPVETHRLLPTIEDLDDDDIEDVSLTPVEDVSFTVAEDVSVALEKEHDEDPLDIKVDSDSDSEEECSDYVEPPAPAPAPVVPKFDPISGSVAARDIPESKVLILIHKIGSMGARLTKAVGVTLQVNGEKLIRHLVDEASRLLSSGLSAEQQQFLSNLLDSIKNLLTQLGKGIEGLAHLVMDLLVKIADFVDFLIAAGEFTINVCEKIWSFIKFVWTYILKPLGCLIKGLAGVLKWFYNHISSALCKIIEKISGINFRKIREEIKTKSGVAPSDAAPPPPKPEPKKKQAVIGLRQKLNEIGRLLKEAGLPLPDGQAVGDVKRDMQGKLPKGKGGRSKRYNRKFSKKYKMTNTIKSRQQQKQNNKKISQRR